MFSQQRFFTNYKQKSIELIAERELWSQQLGKYDGCCDQLQQTDREGIFQVWLYCDQPLACYMQIHKQFTAKATASTVDKFRSSGKQVAVIGCWMGIEENGKITLCSRQNKYRSSQFRVRFVCVKQLREEVQLILVSRSNGAEIKLTMQINNYIWLLKQLNLNKIRFYSEPQIGIPQAWKMLEQYVGSKLQWVCACTYEGEDASFVVRINYRLFIYKVQRTKIGLIHVIGANQSLREKADREWCFIGQKWIAFRSISDRQLYKIYFASLNSQTVSVHKTEWRQVERQVLTEKYCRSGSRHATEVNSISSKTLQERIEDKVGEDECKQGTIHKRLQFSMRKEKLIIQQSERQMEANQAEQVMVDEDDRIIVQDNQFDEQQPHKSQAEEHKSQLHQHDNPIDEEMLDQQNQERSELKQQEVKISIDQIKVQQKIQPKEEAHQDITIKSIDESISRKVSWSNHKSNRKEVDHYDKENCSKAANSVNRHIEFKELKIEEEQVSMSEVSEQPDIAMEQEIMQQNQSSESNLFGFELIANNHNKSQQKSNSKQQDAMIQQDYSLQKTTKLKTIIKSDYFLRNTPQERATTPKKYKHSRTYTQQPQPSTQLHQNQIVKQAASGENYLADVMQVDSDIFAILNSKHDLMLCQSDKLYDYDANGVKLSWKRQTLDPTKLFPSLARQHLHYLQNSTQSIFSYDLNKQKHTQLISYGLLVQHNQIRDVTQTNHHEYILITPTHIKFMDSRLKQFKSRKDLSYRSEHNNFQKIVMQSPHTAVVSQSDGVVKIFDLRASSLRALNRLVLHQTNTKHKEEGICGRLKIVGQAQDIFCTYNHSSYLIRSQTINSQHSLYQRTARYADRQQINQFNLSTGGNPHCFYDISRAGDKIVHWQDGILKYCEASTHKMKTLWRNSGEVGYVGFDVMGESSREDVVWCLMGKEGFSFRRCPIE